MVIYNLLECYQSKLNVTFLFVNQEHIHDVNAYVRSKALHVWLELWKEKVKFHSFLLALPHPQSSSPRIEHMAILLLQYYILFLCLP